MLEAEYEHVTEVVSGFGKLGHSAERIGKNVGKRMAGYDLQAHLQDRILRTSWCCSSQSQTV